MSETKTPESGRPPKGRSPSYPGISLATAIERARTIYEHARQHQVPVSTITSKWGYKSPTTGPASVTYAALKKYGLVTDEGSGTERVGRLTDLAVRVLHTNPEQQDAIREAALTPPIMREWWERFDNDLPPDESLHWEFVVQGPFTDSGLADFLRVYRETVEFADLAVSGAVDSEGGRPGDQTPKDRTDGTLHDGYDDNGALRQAAAEREQRQREQRRKHDAGVLTIPVPMQDSDPVVVEFPGKLSEEDWEYFLTMLTAMKRGVVRRPVEAPGTPSTEG